MKLKFFLFFTMLAATAILPQSSFELTGNRIYLNEQHVYNNSSFESNPSGSSGLNDWGISLSYGAEFSSVTSSSLYLVSLSKRINRSTLTARYTPGYQKEFTFKTGVSIINEDSTLQSLKSGYSYKELFGLGYSYKVKDNFDAGFTLRYINQEFVSENISAVFVDTFYLASRAETEELNLWKADLGIRYDISDAVSLFGATVNLFNFSEGTVTGDNINYELRNPKKGLFGFSYSPADIFNFNIHYETDNSFVTGMGSSFNLFGADLSIGVSAFHDKYQSPFIAGVQPLLSCNFGNFGISLNGVKYFSERSAVGGSISAFEREGITSITNNRYSFDKAMLTVSFTLNTMQERSVAFAGVDILKEIYPALTDSYLNTPFAAGKVVNLTSMPVVVKPETKINGLNSEPIQSPEVTVAPFDTADVYFYTIIPDSYNKEKAEISYADFFVTTENGKPDDQFQSPVLINGINAWDGNVSSLKNFVKRDLAFSVNHTRNLLAGYKTLLDTLPAGLVPFYKAKIIFDDLVKQLTYISDPRATAEYVQFPHQTIKLKGGDCDDLSVCVSALLKSTGIETAFVDFKSTDDIRHVNIIVNTELSASEAGIITMNDSKYFIRKNNSGKDQVWVPVEVTVLSGFTDAWNAGAEKFNAEALNNYGLAKGLVQIVDLD